MLPAALAAPPPATLPLFLPQAPPDKISGLIHAATLLAQLLGQGRALDSRALRSAMEAAFAGTDAEGAWVWKDAYEALEAAQVLFLRKFGAAMRARAGSAAEMLEMLTRLAGRLASQTRRSEESEHFQQFSTPIALGFAACEAAALTPADLVLEPSAGTGLLGIFAELRRARLALNEIAENQAGLLGRLFREVAVTRHNAEQILDRLDPAVRPSVVLMNPPFSASPMSRDASPRPPCAMFHRRWRVSPRAVASSRSPATMSLPISPPGARALCACGRRPRIVFTATIAGKAYVRHGTTIETRLTVIDGVPADDPRALPSSPGMAADASELLDRISRLVPARQPIAAPSLPIAPARSPTSAATAARPKPPAPHPALVKRPAPAPDFAELAYETRAWTPDRSVRFSASLYEGYALQSIAIPHTRPHPTKLVQSAAMAAVAPPRPSYGPLLPPRLLTASILSDAQLESVIYAGEAHSSHLAGSYTVDATYDLVTAAPDGAEGAVRFRRGWFLGDGTGAGKGRQVAAIILDNWLKGRRRAVWISKSDKLIEDAERDWTATGGYRSDIVPLSRFRQGTAIALEEGILFTTYATLRTQAKGDKPSRVQQIIDWLGRDPGRPAPGGGDLTGSSSSTRRTPWPMLPATRANAARRNRRNRARRDCACRTRCMTPASSMSPPRGPRPCRTSPMRRGSASGAPVTFRSQRGPNLSRPWKAAAWPRWRCWPAI